VQCCGESDVFCVDASGNQLASCTNSLCTDPPCTKCYPCNVQASREYYKSSAVINFTDIAQAENCHYLQVCLPWIQDVQSTIQILEQPSLGNSMILGDVAYSCFDGTGSCPSATRSWTIEIISGVGYPLSIQQNGSAIPQLLPVGSSSGFDLVSIQSGSGCGVSGQQCVQTLVFSIPGCNSLQTQTTYSLTGFKYGCFEACGTFISTINPSYLVASGTVQIQATQANCGYDLSIDGTDSISLSMGSYLSDYSTQNTVFVYTADTNDAYFIVTAVSSVPLSSINVESLVRVVNGVTTSVTYTVDTCPSTPPSGTYELCFHVPFTGIGALLTTNSIQSIQYQATVEVSYGNGKKRDSGSNTTGLSTGYSLNKVLEFVDRAIQSSQIETTTSDASVVGPIAALGLFLL